VSFGSNHLRIVGSGHFVVDEDLFCISQGLFLRSKKAGAVVLLPCVMILRSFVFQEFIDSNEERWDELGLEFDEEGYECYCSECGENLEKPDPNMSNKEFERWFCEDETMGEDIMCKKCREK